MATVAIAGASGFVGRRLTQSLSHKLIGLTRGTGALANTENLEWRRCDLFSLLQVERALEGADYAVYLVHSMLPSSELSQGAFQDMDLLIAENFAQAAKKAGVKQIIFLGGIIPEGEKLSLHLESRLEVEKALGSTSVPLTTLRAAMILGPGGSSMNMMVTLVERLPLMATPAWTSIMTKPIFVDDVVGIIAHCIGREECFDRSYDIGGPDLMSYREMMEAVAKLKNLKRTMIPVPVFSPKLSRLWVSTITGAPRSLVLPLIESLKHQMIPNPERLLAPFQLTPFQIALERSCSGEREKITPRAYELPPDEKKRRTVLSVQRLVKPKSMTATDVAKEYLRWLPRLITPFLRIDSSPPEVKFIFFPFGVELLRLELCEERSSDARSLFYVKGGLLDGDPEEGRLEFRTTFDDRYILAALHDFRPRLPWYFYKYSQALVHLLVMRLFGRHLSRLHLVSQP